MVFLLGVAVEEKAWDPGIDLALKLLLVCEVARHVLFQMVREALDEVCDIGVVLYIQVHQVVGEVLVVDCLAE